MKKTLQEKNFTEISRSESFSLFRFKEGRY